MSNGVNNLDQMLASRQHMQVIFDRMLEGILVLNREGKITQFNPAVLKMLNVSAEEIVNVPRGGIWRILREDMTEMPKDQSPASLAFSTGLAQENVTMGVYLSPTNFRWISSTAVPLMREGDAEVFEVLVTMRDITASERSRETLEEIKLKLKQRERFLDKTLSALPSLVSYVDRNYVYQYMNSTYERWYGFKVSECLGKTVDQVLGQKMLVAVKAKMERAFGGEHVDFEQQLPAINGTSRIAKISYIPDIGEDGLVAGIYATVQDITQLRNAEHSVERSARRMEMILDSIPGSIAYWDRNFLNVHANKEYAAFFNMTPAEMKGRHVRNVIGPVLFDKNFHLMEAVLDGKPTHFEREHPQPDGTLKHTLISYLPDLDGSEGLGFYVQMTDITHLKSLESERRAFEVKLIAASKMSSLGEMAGGLAHEINNPLAIIGGKANILKASLANGSFDVERMTRELTKIEDTVERIAKIIRGLRAFARNTENDKVTPTNLSLIFADTLALCQEKIKNSAIQLRIEPVQSLEIQCRASQISQILMNLLSNAIDATEPLLEKWIQVQVEQTEKSVRITVTDSGRGIDPAIVDRIMEPFFTTKDPGKGTGLGLSIAKGLATQNGGSLHYHAGAAHTTFVFELPLHQADQGATWRPSM